MAEKSGLAREWRAMQRRLVKRIAQRTADMTDAPLHISSTVYTDPDRFAAEQQLFLKTPLLAGLSREIPSPGDVLLFDAAGPAIVIVRTENGGVRAFLNRCPHRGSRLVETPARREALVCPYHGWRFGLDGQLLRRPLEEAFTESGETPGLTPVPVAEWNGMVFVRCQPADAPLDVEDFLQAIAPLLGHFQLAGAECIKAGELTVEINWKLALDTFCEPYHVPALHPQTLAPQLVPLVAIHDSYGRHHRYSSPTRAMQALLDQPENDWPETHYNGVHFIYPNTILTCADAIDGHTPVLALFRVFPGETVGQARVLASTYRPAAVEGGDPAMFAAVHDAALQIVQTEDFRIARHCWSNYCQAPVTVTFGRNEMILQRYHADIAADIGRPLPSS